MNERLNKLLDEAKLTAVQEMFEPELEKFAELIVNQCIFEVVQRSTKYYSDNYVVQDFTVDVVNDIKDRFGIE